MQTERRPAMIENIPSNRPDRREFIKTSTLLPALFLQFISYLPRALAHSSSKIFDKQEASPNSNEKPAGNSHGNNSVDLPDYSRLNPDLRFENFKTEASAFGKNQIPVALPVLEIAGRSPEIFSHKVIYIKGCTAAESSHTLHSLANRLQQNHSPLRMRIITTQDMIREFHSSVINHRERQFQSRYLELSEVLLIDNIDEIERSDYLSQFFIHVIDRFLQDGKLLVVASRLAIEQLSISKQLTSRFQDLLILDLSVLIDRE
jgi:chromosomal replication initiation ATPase DnaA